MKNIYIILLAVVMILGSCFSCFAVEFSKFDCQNLGAVNSEGNYYIRFQTSGDYAQVSKSNKTYRLYPVIINDVSFLDSYGDIVDDWFIGYFVDSSTVTPVDRYVFFDQSFNYNNTYNYTDGSVLINQSSLSLYASTASSSNLALCDMLNIIYDSDNSYRVRSYDVCLLTFTEPPFNKLINNLMLFSSPDIGILSIWQSIINFIMLEANRITLLSVTAWLFVIGVGGVRKLVTGV